MSNVTADLSDLEGWTAAMAKKPALLRREIANTMTSAAMLSAATAIDAAPRDLGILVTGIVAMPGRWIGDSVKSAFVSTAPYSRIVEEGRGPIVAKKGKFLRFYSKKHGKVIYRRSVGPAAPRPFMARGRDWAQRNLRAMLQAKVRKVLASR